jgi:arylsulfatase A-like enzyme
MFSWPEWVSPPSSAQTEFKNETTAGVPVYIFVLDEWSFNRSVKNGKFLPSFKNLNQLLEQAIFFEQAYAGGSSTEVTLPRMLFQSRKDLIALDGNAQPILFDPSTGQSKPTRQVRSIFHDFRNDGYRTAMVGFYLPYERLLDEQVDFVKSLRHDPFDGSFWQKLKSTFLNSSNYWVDPISQVLWQHFYRENFSRHWLNLNQQLVDLSLNLVESLPERSIIFNHWSVPHAPYIINPDGSYHGAFPEKRMSGSLEGYNRHLRYLDFLLGSVLQRLKELKRFDQALIVFTSDHNWKRDPTSNYQKNPEELMRVPLIVKWPQQDRPITIKKRVFLNHFLPLLLLARNPENQLEQAVNFIKTTDLDWQ